MDRLTGVVVGRTWSGLRVRTALGFTVLARTRVDYALGRTVIVVSLGGGLWCVMNAG